MANDTYLIIALALGVLNLQGAQESIEAIGTRSDAQLKTDSNAAIKQLDYLAREDKSQFNNWGDLGTQAFIAAGLPDIKNAMLAAVEHGTRQVPHTDNHLKDALWNFSLLGIKLRTTGNDIGQYLSKDEHGGTAKPHVGNALRLWESVNPADKEHYGNQYARLVERDHDVALLKTLFATTLTDSLVKAISSANPLAQDFNAVKAARIALGFDSHTLPAPFTNPVDGSKVTPQSTDPCYMNIYCSKIADAGRFAMYTTPFAREIALAACASYFCKYGHKQALFKAVTGAMKDDGAVNSLSERKCPAKGA